MAYSRGSIIVAKDMFKTGRRPYLVVSNKNRPFFGSKYTVAVISSTSRENAVTLRESNLQGGALTTYPSYVNPWALAIMPDSQISRRVAQVTDETMERVVQGILHVIE